MKFRSNREQQLIRQAIADRGARVLRELESVAATPQRRSGIRDNYDPQWVEQRRRHSGCKPSSTTTSWSSSAADDQIKYAALATAGDARRIDLRTELAPSLDFCAAGSARCPTTPSP